MSQTLLETLRVKFPDGLPPWVDPFIKAVKRMEILQRREKNGTEVTSESREKIKTGKKKKTGKGKVEAEEGLGDDVEDVVKFECAEELLNTAIDLSGGQVVELEPLNPAALFRLSKCYVCEKQYISAHKYYERAVSLLPIPERVPHSHQLTRREEQAKDEKEKVFRADIKSIFPLEIVLNIFQYGMAMDPLFVLPSSWLSRGWRNCLIKSCQRSGRSVMRS